MGIAKKISNSLLISLAFCPVIVVYFLIDQHLAMRSLFLSVCLVVLYYFLASSKLNLSVKVDLLLITKALYAFICCVSVFWAVNYSEAFYSSSKDVLGLLFFLGCILALKLDPVYFLNAISKIVLVLLFATAALMTKQFLQVDTGEPEWIYKIYGFNAHKNLCASFLFLVLFLIAFAIENKSGAWKVIYQVAFVLCLGLIFFLRTKAVIGGLIISTITYLLIWQTRKKTKSTTNDRKKIPVVIYGLVLLFFLTLLPYLLKIPVDNVLIHKLYQVDTERWILWQKSYSMFWKAPWFGVGAGNWQIFFPAEGLQGIWRAEDLNVSFQRPHNDFIWVLCEKGIVGFAIFIFFIVGLIYYLFKNKQTQEESQPKTNSYFFLPALTGWLVISFCDFPAERIEHIMLSNLFFALGYYQVRRDIPVFAKVTAKSSIYIVLWVVVIFCTIISWERVAGEEFTRDLYAAKGSGNLKGIQKAAENATSFAYDLDPTTIPITWYSGSALAAAGDIAGSLEQFEKAYRSHPFQRNVLNDLGTAYVLNGDPRKGELYYIMACHISPRFDEPKLNLAALYIQERKFSLANHWLKSLLHNSEKRSNYQKIVYLETDGKLGKMN